MYEDGPYGTSTSRGVVDRLNKYGMKIVFDEGYSHDAKDMSSLVTKIKAAKPDIIDHTGYYPDISLLLRQSRELGLKCRAWLGGSGGYSYLGAIGKDIGPKLVQYLCNVEVAPPGLLPAESLQPGVAERAAELIKRCKEKYGAAPTCHLGEGFTSNWVLLNEVLPNAITKYGFVPGAGNSKKQAEALRSAFMDLDIPMGGDVLGFGHKYAPLSDKYAGQNIYYGCHVSQWYGNAWHIIYPSALRGKTKMFLPLPSNSVFGK